MTSAMKNLCLIILLICVLTVKASYEESGDKGHQNRWRKFREDMKYCKEKFGLPTGKEDLRSPIPEDKTCYYHCFAERRGLMNKNGQITIERYKKLHPKAPEEMIGNYMTCAGKSEDVEDICDKAKKIHMCLKQKFEKQMERFRQAKRQCMEQFDIPESRKWKPVPDDKICYYKCMAVKMGSMNGDGEFTTENFKEQHPKAPESMIRHLEECAEISKMEDPCESAKALTECVKRKAHW